MAPPHLCPVQQSGTNRAHPYDDGVIRRKSSSARTGSVASIARSGQLLMRPISMQFASTSRNFFRTGYAGPRPRLIIGNLAALYAVV